ncbi:hypothetical protein NPS01_07480 [Nocardioides psychrotolerans]|nr:hypothetical protein NPS01_07480 [Nocardioides psychrotolerans]
MSAERATIEKVMRATLSILAVGRLLPCSTIPRQTRLGSFSAALLVTFAT